MQAGSLEVRKAGGAKYWGISGLSIEILAEICIYLDKEYYGLGLKEFFKGSSAWLESSDFHTMEKVPTLTTLLLKSKRIKPFHVKKTSPLFVMNKQNLLERKPEETLQAFPEC